MSREDAEAALRLAHKHAADSNAAAALKWCRKSIAIYPTPDAQALLQRLESAAAEPPPAKASTSPRPPPTTNGFASSDEKAKARATTTDASPSSDATSSGLRNRNVASSSSTNKNGATPSSSTSSSTSRDYTPAQEAVVKKVNAAGKKRDFYGVLGLEKSDAPDDTAIKRGYRKLALQLHPDKNGAPGADEAFKIVSKAFTILSDPDKRAVYDRTGADPDDRSAGRGGGGAGFPAGFGGRAGGAPFRTYGNAGGAFGQEIDPQDLFNMFFGGGMGGGFGGGGTTFTFGAPGFQARHYHAGGGGPGGARRARPQQAEGASSVLLQLLPILILGLFSLLSYLPSLFATPDPSFTWAPSGVHREARFTPQRGVSYYVDARQWEAHPFVQEAKRGAASDLKGFEARVENAWRQVLYNTCERQREHQQRRIMSTRGFLGIGSDPELERRIRAEKYEACERLQDWGIYM